ncbi:MAG: DUF222 domain-containing protein [Actinomycetes bacterium]
MSSTDDAARTMQTLGVDVDGLELPGLDQLPRQADGTIEGGALVTHLGRLTPDELETDYDVLELVAAWDRVSSWVSAQQLVAIAEFARRPDVLGADPELAKASRAPVGRVIRSHPDDEIGAQLGVSRVAASSRLSLALKLADTFRPTAQALAHGRIDLAKARVIVDECAVAEPEHLEALQRQLIGRALTLTPPRLRTQAQRAVMAIDPEAAQKRSTAKRAESQVLVTPTGDGVAELWAQLPLENAVAIEQVVDAVAKRLQSAAGPADTRTIDQWRAEALALPFVKAIRTGTLDGEQPIALGTRGRSPVRINVSVPASVLLGLSDAPAELQGYGPIPAALARIMAEDSTWRRVLTDDAGRVTEVGSDTYRPGSTLARTVQMRHQLCVFPGCGARAERCDLDHVVRHPRGPTDISNLVPECRRHHISKHRDDLHDGGEQQVMLAQSRSQPPPPPLQTTDASKLLWTMPTGHQHVLTPPVLAEPCDDQPFVDAVLALGAASTDGSDRVTSAAETALRQLLAA